MSAPPRSIQATAASILTNRGPLSEIVSIFPQIAYEIYDSAFLNLLLVY
ncbi:hypothetical protein CHELA1G11_14176 [Hyphomicrobiales bacterium]|nr:hypothetical protein CHELA1G2_10138 [Hyphomicrobiales bacterium]CAH1676759.1 hypothetical protein CHELA1G11_14176 [Hyphomicrobiales bacterium]